ncbi:hypothetical protein Glove_144g140 [Diversispora epigaea]|uniref:Uncharacterized protein n=1 Tax=Diversispora epigaea TaxID=1348612 RepID=A0A397IWV4_9GLOM|nr:hypothetical protein Glove_144g140 [Diversispora epigaea]
MNIGIQCQYSPHKKRGRPKIEKINRITNIETSNSGKIHPSSFSQTNNFPQLNDLVNNFSFTNNSLQLDDFSFIRGSPQVNNLVNDFSFHSIE